MKVPMKKALLALTAAAALTGTAAIGVAQEHGRSGPPGAQPAPRPGMPGMPGGQQFQPRPGMQQLPGGHPAIPGQRPGGFGPPGQRPGLPPGFMPHGRPRPQGKPAHEEEHSAHHECPGHGAEDAPPPPNWWRGIFMVNNERAQKGGFVNELLFRYENEKDPCDAKNLPPPFLASVLNFGLLAFIVYRFGKKPLAEALKKRKATIMAEIDTATRLKEDAESRLEEYEERIENIEAKLEEVRREYAAQAEIEKKHILAEAEERRVRMRKDAEFRIEQELKTARAELLEEAVINAVAAAEALVAKQVDKRDQDRMASDYLASIAPSLQGAR